MKWELNQYKLHGKNIKPIQNPCNEYEIDTKSWSMKWIPNQYQNHEENLN